MTKEIDVGNGAAVMLVDDEDYPVVSRHRWQLGTDGYARLTAKWPVAAHQMIMPVGPGFQVDHRNKDRLDNRKENLRPAQPWQNISAALRREKRSTNFMGVYHEPKKGAKPWRAIISVQRKRIDLGHFATEAEAAAAYDEASAAHRGEFAPPRNIPIEGTK